MGGRLDGLPANRATAHLRMPHYRCANFRVLRFVRGWLLTCSNRLIGRFQICFGLRKIAFAKKRQRCSVSSFSVPHQPVLPRCRATVFTGWFRSPRGQPSICARAKGGSTVLHLPRPWRSGDSRKRIPVFCRRDWI